MIYDFAPAAYMSTGLDPVTYARKSSIDDLTNSMLLGMDAGELKPVELPLEHFHPAGLYGRKIFMPAGTVLTSRVHTQQHLTAVLAGKCRVIDQDGTETMVEAPAAWITEPGTHRALHIIEDSIWLTVHATDQTDVAELEETLTCPTWADYQTKLIGGNV